MFDKYIKITALNPVGPPAKRPVFGTKRAVWEQPCHATLADGTVRLHTITARTRKRLPERIASEIDVGHYDPENGTFVMVFGLGG